MTANSLVSCRVAQGSEDFYYLQHEHRRDLAWSGSKWVPHKDGIPTGDWTVKRYQTINDALKARMDLLNNPFRR